MSVSPSERSLRQLLTGAGLSVSTYLTGIVLGLLLTPYMVRTLGERDYAIFLFAGIFTNWCGLIDFGMTTAVSRFITLYHSSGDRWGVGETANTAILLMAGLGGVALVVSVLAAGVAKIGWRQTPEIDQIAVVFLLAGSGFAVSKITDAFSGIIAGSLRQEITGAIALSFRIITGILLFAILFFGGRVLALVAGMAGLTVAQWGVTAFLVRKAAPDFVFSPHFFRRERVRELFGYSVWTFVNQMGDLLIQRSDLIIIAALLSLVEVTHYNLAVVVLISYYGSFLQAMSLWQTNWFTHLLSRSDGVLLERSRLLSGKIMTLIAAFFSINLIFWGKAFLIRWVGPTVLDAYGALVLLAAGMAFYRGNAETNIRLLQGLARHRRLAILTILQGVASVALGILFIRLGFGLVGVALGTLLPAALVHGVIVPLEVGNIFGESVSRYGCRTLRTLAAAGTAGIVPVFLFRRFLVPDWPTLFWTAAVGGIFYFSVVWFLAFTKEERGTMAGFFLTSFLKRNPDR